MDRSVHYAGDVRGHHLLQRVDLVAYQTKQCLATGPKGAATAYHRFYAAGTSHAQYI